MEVDVKVAQLLCSRLCHDIVSPIGAVNAGVELIEEGGDADGRAMGLIATSAGEAARRLAFFRVAFGVGAGVQGSAPLMDARTLAVDFLKGGKAALDWPDDADINDVPVPSNAAKVVLNMVLIASESLPRGGTVGVHVRPLNDGVGVAVVAAGAGARLRDDVRMALAGDAAGDELTARNVHGHYAQCLARALGGAIETDEGTADEVHLAALFPAGPG
ncbi:MAG TPA: histidine phosphotransferase family protein [Rhodospirillales bacterium]|jgi:histidine phosphotransferase ChpT